MPEGLRLVGADDAELGEIMFGNKWEVFGFYGVVDTDQFGINIIHMPCRRGRHHQAWKTRDLMRPVLDVMSYRVTFKALRRFVAFAALAFVGLFYPGTLK